MSRFLCVASLFYFIPTAALSWSTPVAISPLGDTGTSIPRIAAASDGRVFVTWRRKFPDWRLFYRERSSSGAWGPVETVSVPWSERPDIIQDPQGRPHMFYAGTGAGGKTDLFEAIKYSTGWVCTQFTNTDTIDEDYPKLGVDSLGRMHLVYTKNNNVYHRIWNGSWSGETYLGQCENAYYHRPDLSVAPDNTIHVTWENRSTFYYRKFNGSTWLPTQVIGTTTNFFAYGKIAAISSTHIVAVTFDQLTSAALKWTCSTDGGATWTPLAYLNDGHYPSLKACGGKAHLVYQWAGSNCIGYRQWDGTAWSAAQRATPDTRWQGWPDVAVDIQGNVHVVYDDDSSELDQIYYVCSAKDNIPPQPVAGFVAAASDQTVYLSWTNPGDFDFAFTKVVCRTDRYPVSPSDGLVVCQVSTAPGSPSSYIHRQLTNGLTYYYAAFAFDTSSNWSASVCASATPYVLSCFDAKQMSDNLWVRLTNKVVTLVYSTSGYAYVQDPSRVSGIRVSGSFAGITEGDVVDVEGYLGTRFLSGLPSERQIGNATVTKKGSATVTPVAMQCRSVGGGPAGPLVPGVVGGIGTNNIGLFVKIAGKVTAKLNDTIWVDDGSNILDPSGKTGVLVKCPDSNIPANIGDIVSLAGVVEGSIPVGYPGNRRQIRLGSYANLRIYR